MNLEVEASNKIAWNYSNPRDSFKTLSLDQLETDRVNIFFENDLKAILPELFLSIQILVLLLYGVIVSNNPFFRSIFFSNKITSLLAYSHKFLNRFKLEKGSQELKLRLSEQDFNRLESNKSILNSYVNTKAESLLLTKSLGITGNVSCLALLTLFYTLLLGYHNPIQNASLFYNTFRIDCFSLFANNFILIAASTAILIQLSFIDKSRLNQFEIVILSLLSVLSMFFLVSASHLIALYLAIELQSLCFYCMAGIKRDSEFSTEAGIKYFVLGALSSGILLFGFSLQYGFTGSLRFSEFAAMFQSDNSLFSNQSYQLKNIASETGNIRITEQADGLFSFALSSVEASWSTFSICCLAFIPILIGFLFKLSAAPFHMWSPDVYEGAPTSVTAFFAILGKIAILVVLLRLGYQAFHDFVLDWQFLFLISSLASMLLGTFATLSQSKIKRLMAYSSIAHVGFILLGVSCLTTESIQSAIVYLVIYFAISSNLFAVLLLNLRREQNNPALISDATSAQRFNSKSNYLENQKSIDLSKKVESLKYITDLAVSGKTNPLVAICFTVAMFSIAGIPPLAGFLSKAFLLFAAMSAQQSMIAIIGILVSVVSCFYYIRLVRIMFFVTDINWLTFSGVSKASAFVLSISLAFLLFVSIKAESLFLACHEIALFINS